MPPDSGSDQKTKAQREHRWRVGGDFVGSWVSMIDFKFCKYPTTLHRSSFDLINVLAIFGHGISFEKNSLATWGFEPGSPVINQHPYYSIDIMLPHKKS